MSRVFCIGQNYIEHIRELGNPMPDKPVVFIRPQSCLVKPGQSIHFPTHGCQLHYEVEVVVLIGKPGRNIPESQALSFINAITLGADLTLRDLQKQAKEKGLPWEESKSFEQSSPLGDFITYEASRIDLKNLKFKCKINNEVRQNGNTEDMLFSFEKLISYLSGIWHLQPGDMIYTGTPSGVGSLNIGDVIEIENDHIGSFSWTMIE